MTQEKLLNIASQFALEGEIASIDTLGEGFINDTFVVTTVGEAPAQEPHRLSRCAGYDG